MSNVNSKLIEASTCPFFNMARTSTGMTVDENGNADRAEIKALLRNYGVGADMRFLLDVLSAYTQKDDGVPKGKLNVTRLLNLGKINHAADMHIVDQEEGKVDEARLADVVRMLEEAGEDGVVDQLCLAKVQQQCFMRDRKRKDRRLQRILYRWKCNTLALGENAMMLLMIGHREMLTRVRIVHVEEIRAFLDDGRMPDGWKRDFYYLHNVLGLLFLMAIEKGILRLPLFGAQHLLVRIVAGAHALFLAVVDRIVSSYKWLIPDWTSANLTTRARLRAAHPKTGSRERPIDTRPRVRELLSPMMESETLPANDPLRKGLECVLAHGLGDPGRNRSSGAVLENLKTTSHRSRSLKDVDGGGDVSAAANHAKAIVLACEAVACMEKNGAPAGSVRRLNEMLDPAHSGFRGNLSDAEFVDHLRALAIQSLSREA